MAVWTFITILLLFSSVDLSICQSTAVKDALVSSISTSAATTTEPAGELLKHCNIINSVG